MDNTGRDKLDPHEDEQGAARTDDVAEDANEGPAAGALIAANLTGVNAGSSIVSTAAPNSGNLGGVSADQAAAVAGGDDDTDLSPMNFDALEQFGSGRRETGDEGVSTSQSEAEADQLNG
jgi:hypothetical protein